jgi:hypothetical protein
MEHAAFIFRVEVRRVRNWVDYYLGSCKEGGHSNPMKGEKMKPGVGNLNNHHYKNLTTHM